MPIYEYVCLKCNEKFSLLQNIHASGHDTCCPKCSSKEIKKVISAFCCSPGSGGGESSTYPSGGFSGGG